MNRIYYMSVMQNTHRSEIFLSEEMKRYEKLNFIKKSSYFFMENAGKSELDIINEIDRYIVMPGQALAYKIGQMKLLELRKKAKEELDTKFDIRDFHDAVLKEGALPLNELELIVDRYILDNK